MSAPRTLAALTALCADDLHILGLTDAHIAALDAADGLVRASHESHPVERRRLAGQAARATERAAGATVADAAAILGYWPTGAPTSSIAETTALHPSESEVVR